MGTAVSLVFLLAVIVNLSSDHPTALFSIRNHQYDAGIFPRMYDWLTDFFVDNPPVEQAILNI
ncbi:MAG: hypothetical protein ACLUAR_16945 [Pilosibacter sp.]